MRERHIPDTRVHVVLFFINPSGHSLRQIDIQVLKKLGDIANVIPVIAKADTLTLEERDPVSYTHLTLPTIYSV